MGHALNYFAMKCSRDEIKKAARGGLNATCPALSGWKQQTWWVHHSLPRVRWRQWTQCI